MLHFNQQQTGMMVHVNIYPHNGYHKEKYNRLKIVKLEWLNLEFVTKQDNTQSP